MKKRIAFLLASSISCICFLPVKAQQKITSKRQVIVYTSAKGTELRLSQNGLLSFKEFKQPLETEPTIFIDPSHTYQSFLGIGGAFTDASAGDFAKLPRQQQQEFLKAYYDPKDGIGYTIGRTNINSCDFSSGSYTYVDENDKGLKSFTVAHDMQYKIPFIKQAMAATGGKLLLFA